MKFDKKEKIGLILIALVIIGGATALVAVNKPSCGDGICQENEQNSCLADCDWCGDGVCQSAEEGICAVDCDWCGDKFCQEQETCTSCNQDCGSCKTGAYCGDGTCNPGECLAGCSKDCDIKDCQNGVCEASKGETCVSAPGDCACAHNQYCDTTKKKCVTITCGNGICEKGETPSTCSADCKEAYIEKDLSNENYPVIFIHGHSVSNEETTANTPNSWTDAQEKLAADGVLINKGVILASDNINAYPEGIWGSLDKPIAVRTTYYKGYVENDKLYINSEDEKSIIEYGERLKQVVAIVKHHTGKDKVILVGHSMGGLVARSYIENSGGEDNVYALITVGTPHHGVDGKESQVSILGGGLPYFCQTGLVFIEGHNGAECEELWYNSTFIRNLNAGDETPGSIQYYSLMGSCCSGTDGTPDDEVVSVESATLDGAQNIIFYSSERSGTNTLHQELEKPSKMPEAYQKIKEILLSLP